MTKTKKKGFRWWLLIILALGAGLWSSQPAGDTFSTDVVRTEKSSRERAFINVQRLIPLYIDAHASRGESFWLRGDENPSQWMSKVYTWTGHITELMGECEHSHPLMAHLNGAYRDNFVVSMLTPQGFTQILTDDSIMPQEAVDRRMRNLEIVIVPQVEVRRYRQPSYFWFKNQWNALMVTSVEVPEAFEVALVAHELGHALRFRQGAESATAHPDSTSFIEEEVEMHQLEAAVLDCMVEGRLEGLYAQITRRSGSRGDPYDVLAQVEGEDLLAFDSVINGHDMGPRAAGVALMQFWTGLAFHVMGTNAPDDRSVEFYRWMRESASVNK